MNKIPKFIAAVFFALVMMVQMALHARTITGTAFVRQQQQAGASDSLLYSVKVQNVSGGTATQWAQFGVPIKQGDIPTGKHLRLKSAAGAVLTQQHDQIVTNTDGSLRFAVASIRTTSLANNDSLTVNVYRSDTATDTASSLNADTILNSDYTVSIVIGGTTWTASLDTAIAQHSRYTAHGACRRSWRAWAPFFSGSSKHAQLWCRWYVDFWADTNISVFPQIINGYFKAGDTLYTISSWSFNRGAAALRTGTNLGQWHHSIWMPCTTTGDPQWSKTAQKTHVKYDPLVFFNSKHCWKYMDVDPPAAGALSYSPLGSGSIQIETGTTGDRPDIGPIPTWSVNALLSQDAGWVRYNYINALSWMSSPTHYYDSTSGEIPVLNNTTYSGMGAATPDGGWFDNNSYTDGHNYISAGTQGGWSGTGGGDNIDASHLPETQFYAYITKGYYWLYDEQLMLGEHSFGNSVWDYRNITIGTTVHYGISLKAWQMRTAAWELRSKMNSWFVCHDGHPAKTYWNDIVRGDWIYGDSSVAHMSANQIALGSWTTHNVDEGEEYGCTQPYMDDYFGTSEAMAYWRGLPCSTFVNHHLRKFCLGKVCVPNGLFRSIAYRMAIKTSNLLAFLGSWTDVHVSGTEGTYPTVDFLTPDSTCLSSMNSGEAGYGSAGGYGAIEHMMINCTQIAFPSGNAIRTLADSADGLIGPCSGVDSATWSLGVKFGVRN